MVVVVVIVVVVVVLVVVVVVRGLSILSAVPRVVSSPADRQGSPGLVSAGRLYVQNYYIYTLVTIMHKRKRNTSRNTSLNLITRYNIS